MKSNRFLILLILSLSTMIGWVGCSDDEPKNSHGTIVVTCEIRDVSDAAAIYAEVLYTLTERNSGKSTARQSEDLKSLTIDNLPIGLYDVKIQGKVRHKVQGKERTNSFEGVVNNVNLQSGKSERVNIKADLINTSPPAPQEGSYRDLVISEIFPTGSKIAGKKGLYRGDQYIMIYNPTDQVIYADSIAIFETEFMSIAKYAITPDLNNTCVPVGALYMIPGKGKDVAIQPGKYILICDIAQDHRPFSPNSFDLSKADFEWYDDSPNPKVKDVDNPAIPNLDKIYCYTQTIWAFHNRGFKSIGIAKMQTSKEKYLAEYEKPYVWKINNRDVPKKTYILPTEWIVDAVCFSIPNGLEWNVMPMALDRGFTYVSLNKGAGEEVGNAGMAVIRKRANGNKLQDTNNSTDDFIPHTKPSLAQ